MNGLPDALRGLSPEDRILLLCCRERVEGAGLEWFSRAVAAGPEWERLMNKGTYHRMLGLVYYHFHSVGALDEVPAPARERLEAEAALMRRVKQQQEETLFACLGVFEDAGLEMLLLKGPMLQGLYPPGAPRASYDLDLLLREADFRRALRVLRENGFRLATRAPGGLGPREAVAFAQYFEQFRFEKTGAIPLEVHFRLYNYGVPDAREPVWERVRAWEVGGREAPGLCPEDLLLYLVTHLNLHAFGRMLWYFDVAAFYRQWSDRLDWDLIFSRARHRRLGDSFYHSLRWVCELVYPECAPPKLEALRPPDLRSRVFERVWRKEEVFALKSFIRPFDAARYYLLGESPVPDKLRYVFRVLLPPPRWLGTYLDAPPSVWLNFRYLRDRRRERKNWGTITRKDRLLT